MQSEIDQPTVESAPGKRKADDESDGGRPRTKRRHDQLELAEMPADVLLEIFGRVEPSDLLNLARTSKSFRNLLMTRSSISVWRAARSSVPGPPMLDCPSDLNEPQYAYLAFGKDCYFCGQLSNHPIIFWAARIRTCETCLSDDNYFMAKGSCRTSKTCPADLKCCLPVIRGWSKLRMATWKMRDDRRLPLVFPVHMKVLWQEQYQNAKNKKKWLAQNKKRQNIIDEHAKACSEWFDNLDFYRSQEKALLVGQRRSAIVKYIQKLGWGDELTKISNSVKKPQDYPIVTAACQQPLTYDALSGLETFINEFMEDTRAKRLSREHETFLVASLPELNQIYHNFVSTLPVNTLYPTTICDVLQDSAVRRIIDTAPHTLPGCVLGDTEWFSLFPEVIRRWETSVDDKLIALITNACGDKYAFDPKTVLNLATTWFTCSRCREHLRHPRVLMHKCATHVFVDRVDPDIYTAVVKRLLWQIPWNSLGCISFELKNLVCMTKVVELCGFNPKITTIQDMNAASPIIECVACNHPREGRPVMMWPKVLDHLHTIYSGMGDMKLEVLCGQEKTIAHARMHEIQAWQRARLDYTGLICAHCKRAGNMVDLTNHVKLRHDRSRPTDEDILPVVDEDHVPDIYWLWPPREDSKASPPTI
ncbi:hypothetical protein BDZ97DRAFT_801129 [Flammula alnicola]|nr:hypothetical protein BDZ97DRAFT_801129 [Flammula alnicola]